LRIPIASEASEDSNKRTRNTTNSRGLVIEMAEIEMNPTQLAWRRD
jgi:hypothetical protein